MRRSAAPSQQSNRICKKPCFRVPYANTSNLEPTVIGNHNTNSRVNKESQVVHTPGINKGALSSCGNEARSTLDVLKLLTKTPLQDTATILCTGEQANAITIEKDDLVLNENILKNKLNKDADDKLSFSNLLTSCFIENLECNDTQKDKTEDSCDVKKNIYMNVNNDQATHITQYFSVMWCKLSKKKHKKWEGDGIMTVKERTAILQDLEGKEISKRSGFKLQELQNLEEGQSIIVGNKECEIQNRIQEKDFLTGKCFLAETKEVKENMPKTIST